MSARDNSENVSRSVVQDNGFGDLVPGSMRSMDRSRTCRRARMGDDIVVDTLAVQILPKPDCYCHGPPPTV
jgi:hypothetical protein